MVIVASLLQIMDCVGSSDSSRDLQPIHVKKIINRLHLVLYACVEIGPKRDVQSAQKMVTPWADMQRANG